MTGPDLAELRRLLDVARAARGLERIMHTWDRLAREAIDALPALLDAAAERDALAAKVERVRALVAAEDQSDYHTWASTTDILRALDEEPQP